MQAYQVYLSLTIITGAFVLAMVLILIALLVKHNSIGKSKTFSSVRNFTLCFFAIILLFYYESFDGMFGDAFERGTLSRIADFSLFILLEYFWLAFMRTVLGDEERKIPNIDKIINVLLIIGLVVSDFNCIVLLDPNYYIAEPAARAFGIATEVVLCVLWCGSNFYYLWEALKRELVNTTRCYVIAETILLAVSLIYNEVVTIKLMAGRMPYEVEAFYYDPSFLLMLLTVAVTLVYLYKHDFSPIYFHEQPLPELSDEEVLENIAAEKGLSKRELEIAKLILKGDSYEEIAESLFISKLTVKKHVHNFYEKLEVAKRMDLINLVRDEKINMQQKKGV